jgi:hypothetical protein
MKYCAHAFAVGSSRQSDAGQGGMPRSPAREAVPSVALSWISISLGYESSFLCLPQCRQRGHGIARCAARRRGMVQDCAVVPPPHDGFRDRAGCHAAMRRCARALHTTEGVR